jgi:hypothetical protein
MISLTVSLSINSDEDIERMAKDDANNFLKTDEEWERAVIHHPGIRCPKKLLRKNLSQSGYPLMWWRISDQPEPGGNLGSMKR